MAKADHIHTTSRRAAFGMAGAAILIAGAGVAPGPDAELIAVCREFSEIERYCRGFYDQASAVFPNDEAREAFLEPTRDRQEVLLNRMCELRATTSDGHTARCRSLAAWTEDLDGNGADEEGYWNERMLAALLRDVTAGREP